MYILYDGIIVGKVTANHNLTLERACELADLDIAITVEDYENLETNGKYDISMLSLV